MFNQSSLRWLLLVGVILNLLANPAQAVEFCANLFRLTCDTSSEGMSEDKCQQAFQAAEITTNSTEADCRRFIPSERLLNCKDQSELAGQQLRGNSSTGYDAVIDSSQQAQPDAEAIESMLKQTLAQFNLACSKPSDASNPHQANDIIIASVAGASLLTLVGFFLYQFVYKEQRCATSFCQFRPAPSEETRALSGNGSPATNGGTMAQGQHQAQNADSLFWATPPDNANFSESERSSMSGSERKKREPERPEI